MSVVPDREIPLTEVLPIRAANGLTQNGIATLNELIRLIEAHGLASWSTQRGVVYGLPLDVKRKHMPLAKMGSVTWKAELRMLDQVGFDWRRYLLETSPTIRAIAQMNAQQLHAASNANIGELLRLLRRYQELKEREALDTTQLELLMPSAARE